METYKKIEGFENYSVSDFGNVRNDKTGKIKNVNVDIKGYVRVTLSSKTERKNKFIQRLVARAFILNPENKPQVDHIDNNRANNNIKNLRWTTISQNTQNRQLTTKNTSGSKGVSWRKDSQKWRAQITINGKTITLGCFVNKEDAINIRVQRAKDVFGEYINKCELVIT